MRAGSTVRANWPQTGHWKSVQTSSVTGASATPIARPSASDTGVREAGVTRPTGSTARGWPDRTMSAPRTTTPIPPTSAVMRRIGDPRLADGPLARDDVDAWRSAARRARLVWPTAAFEDLLTWDSVEFFGWRGRIRSLWRSVDSIPSGDSRREGHEGRHGWATRPVSADRQVETPSQRVRVSRRDWTDRLRLDLGPCGVSPDGAPTGTCRRHRRASRPVHGGRSRRRDPGAATRRRPRDRVSDSRSP